MVNGSPGRVLVLAPHTDDAELGCGGTLAQWRGATKKVVAFSDCEWDDIGDEFAAACGVLGVQATELLTFERRIFEENRQEVLDELLRIGAEFEPELVIAPSLTDLHQDHQTLAMEALRAFRRCSLWTYELPWNQSRITTRAFVRLDEWALDMKLEALSRYRTQTHREYFDPEFVRGLARIRGVQIGAKYAEAFDIVREVR